MNQTCDKLLIDINLAGLYSEDRFTRELSVFHLQNYLSQQKVLAELKQAMLRESDPELKWQIKSLLELVEFEDPQSEKNHAPEAEQRSADEIWFENPELSVDGLFVLIKELDEAGQVEILSRVIENETNPLRLIPFFSRSEKILQNSRLVSSFAGKLNSRVDVFLIRLILFLHVNAPEQIIRRFKFLLGHENFYVKVLTLRTLHRFYPAQAIRLLHELLVVRESNLAACNLLFLFPFEDVKDIVVKMLEGGALQDVSIKMAIENLVLNNPDPEFFMHLVQLEVLRGEGVPGLIEVCNKALEGLEISGMLAGDRESFWQKNREKCLQKLKKQMGSAVVLDFQPPSKNTGAIDSLSEKASTSKNLSGFLEKSKIDKEDKQAFAEYLAQQKEPDSQIFRVIRKFNITEDFVKLWLEENLFSAQEEIRIQAAQLLAETDFSRLLPHLPVLCMDSNTRVALNSVRLFRKYAEKALLKWLENWLREDSDMAWRAALAGLLQVNADDARNLLLKQFAATERVSFIRFFSPVFSVSPDFKSMFKLERLLEGSRGAKREALFDLLTLLRQQREKTSPVPGEALVHAAREGFRDHLEGISDTLEKFSFLTDENEIIESVRLYVQKKWRGLAIVSLLFILALSFAYRTTSGDQTEDNYRRNSQAAKADELPIVKVGAVKFMTFRRYDPINQLWEATGSDGTKYKLKLLKPERFAPKFKGNFEILHYRVSFSGHPVVTCRYVEP